MNVWNNLCHISLNKFPIHIPCCPYNLFTIQFHQYILNTTKGYHIWFMYSYKSSLNGISCFKSHVCNSRIQNYHFDAYGFLSIHINRTWCALISRFHYIEPSMYQDYKLLITIINQSLIHNFPISCTHIFHIHDSILYYITYVKCIIHFP